MAPVPDWADNNHWLNLLRIDLDVYGRDRESLMVDLREQSIETRPVWRPNHRQNPYRKCQTYKIERAEKLLETSLCLPSSGQMTNGDISKVIDCLHG